jgi:hypothetical protein
VKSAAKTGTDLDFALNEWRKRGYLQAADDIAEPYPPEVFTPMTDDEIKVAVAAMNEAVPHASERMHAAWARHWADVLRRTANGETT